MLDKKIDEELINKYYEELRKNYNDETYDEIVKINNKYINNFAAELKKSGLSEKTIKNHISNLDLFLNQYMLKELINNLFNGYGAINMFMEFYINKCMYSNASGVKELSISIKKFYKFMLDLGFIDDEDLYVLKELINENLDNWIKEA